MSYYKVIACGPMLSLELWCIRFRVSLVSLERQAQYNFWESYDGADKSTNYSSRDGGRKSIS